MPGKQAAFFLTGKNLYSSNKKFSLTSIIFKYYHVKEMGGAENCTGCLIKEIWQLKISLNSDCLTAIFLVNSEQIHVRQLMVFNSSSLARPHSPKQCAGTLSCQGCTHKGFPSSQMHRAWLQQCRTSWPCRVNFSRLFLPCLDPVECVSFLFHQCTMTCILGRETCKHN